MHFAFDAESETWLLLLFSVLNTILVLVISEALAAFKRRTTVEVDFELGEVLKLAAIQRGGLKYQVMNEKKIYHNLKFHFIKIQVLSLLDLQL